MSKKNNKKNLKKVQAKIGTTPVKAEAAKKEESNAANETIKNIEKRRAADAEKAKKHAELKAAKKKAKAEKEEAKYAASKARAEARKARKKSIMDKLIDSKKEKASEPVKITLEDRLKKQEERRYGSSYRISYPSMQTYASQRCRHQEGDRYHKETVGQRYCIQYYSCM